jgi:hypothetical protein
MRPRLLCSDTGVGDSDMLGDVVKHFCEDMVELEDFPRN